MCVYWLAGGSVQAASPFKEPTYRSSLRNKSLLILKDLCTLMVCEPMDGSSGGWDCLIEFEVKTIVGSFYTTYQPVNVCVCLDFGFCWHQNPLREGLLTLRGMPTAQVHIQSIWG